MSEVSKAARMLCPHCSINFHENFSKDSLTLPEPANSRYWHYKSTVCPRCKGVTIWLYSQVYVKVDSGGGTPVGNFQEEIKEFQAYPFGSSRPPTPVQVPTQIAQDYEEACRVLPFSSKASAALSRRCLQAILVGHGYTQKNLAEQIDAALDEQDARKALPSHIGETIDAIRNFGNFSAHPITDATTLQIVDVEPGEAEWCIEITEELFDHYYVKPAAAMARKAALNKKLSAAKKPPAK